jgi:HPt (histidine-containing phosphotransfer) domain-containing protein
MATALRLAHDLKSVSGSLGAMGVSDAAGALEQACAHGAGPDDIDARLASVVAQLDPVIAGLHAAGRPDKRIRTAME